MKKHFHKKALALLVLFLPARTGFGGEADRQEEGWDAGVVLGEEDLAERAEIARNAFRRITPGNDPFVQDVGTWPVAWEEFPSRWAGAATGREYGAWVVPVSVERENGATVIRDAGGTELWRGTTDFAKEESASVTLTGGLVAEEEWDGYEGVRDFANVWQNQGIFAEHWQNGMVGRAVPASRTNGLRFTSVDVETNGSVALSLAWEEDGDADIFVCAVPHDPGVRVFTWTNDENQVVTVTNTVWTMAGPNLSGFDNDWEWRGTATVTNGEGLFVDTGIPDYLGVMRFYAAAEANDTDGDGWNDGWERFVFHTDPTVPNNGNPDPSGTNGTTNVFWFVTTTNEWTSYGYQYLGNQSSWPEDPVHKAQLVVTGAPPMSNALPVRVAVSGLVDDAITVDGNQVWWTNGAKVFEDFEVTESITNLAGGSFRVDLHDWPDLPDGGDNEVRLGREDLPFRVEWTWAVPMEFRLEHITTNGAPLVVNPSGTEPNREITCVATVLPTNIPDSDIHWEVSGAGMDFVGGTNWGREVHIAGTSNGTWTATVTVSNSTLSPARLQGRVLEKKDVNVYLHIVRDDNGNNPAMTVEHFDELLAVANQIWEQAAIEFHRAGNVMYTNRTDWLEIPVNDNWAAYDALQSWNGNTGGIEVYCINQFANTNILGQSCTDTNATAGLTIVSTASARTLAHELGHACGLNDIYTNLVVNNVEFTLYDGVVLSVCAQGDWCEEARNGGYGDLTLHPMVCRLLMYGEDKPDLAAAVDIPAKKVYGLMNTGQNTSVAVGLNDMGLRNPRHW